MHSRHFKICIISIFSFIIITGITNLSHAASTIKTPASCPATLTQGSMGVAYSYTFAGTGGGPSPTWSLTAGSLPAGLSLNAMSGVLSGIPTAAGTYNFTVTYAGTSSVSCVCTLPIVVVAGGGCAFAGTNIGTASFNNIDPSTTPGPIYSSIPQQVLFSCDPVVAYSFTTNPVNPTLTGPISIPFTLALASLGQNISSAVQIPLFPATPPSASSILFANYENAPAGAYSSGNINVTISWTGASSGSITATVTASGSVLNTCAVSQSPGTLTFTINPSITGTTSATISQDMQIKCTKNDPVSITASSKCGGATPLLDTAYPACGGTTISYTFNFQSSSTGQGFGIALPLNIGGSVNSTNYENAAVGNYGDLQTLTITY